MKIQKLPVNRAEEIKGRYSLSTLCAKVLASKQLADKEIDALFQPPVLADPFSATGMKDVIERITQAKEKQEKVMVCGDYDADGICATTILVDTLRRYGLSCGFYIPNRFKEGYGLSVATVVKAAEKGYKLLITVDNGVKALDALKKASELQVDVIVTDHHAMEEELPCLYLLHPFLMGERFETLSGAGVALKLSNALLGSEVKEHVVLACVAAIADVMPLKQETRDIVRLGITYLKQGFCQPIQQLANDRNPNWDEMVIAFQIVPKLNATGRLADMVNVNNTVKYLLMDDVRQIQPVSKQITVLNDQRKVMSEKMVALAKTLIHPEYSFQLLFHETFHEGMAGLVAGKLSEELQLPVMVAAQNDTHFKGSIRSLGLLDLTSFFDECHILDSYGGHKAAAGIGFHMEKKQQVQDYVNSKMQDYVFQNEICYDVIEADLQDLSFAQVQSLSQLMPFGQGFEEPLFYIPDVAIKECKALGKGLHTKWVINENCEAMMFSSKDYYDKLHDKKYVTFIGNLRINSFMGKKKVNIFVTDAF